MLPNDIQANIGERLKLYRIQNGYSQSQFCEQIGISPEFLSELEHGKVGFSTDILYKLCKHYKISADYLLFGKEQKDFDGDKFMTSIHSLNSQQASDLLDIINQIKGHDQ